MNQLEQNRISYNEIADAFSDYRAAMDVGACIRNFAEMLPEGARILDAGCGCGRPIAEYLAERGFSVVGIDIAENLLQKARAMKLKNAEFRLCDFLDYPESETFDAIVAFDSLWHIEEQNQPLVYQKVSALLGPGGYFLFTAGRERGTVTGNMFNGQFIYSALSRAEIKNCLSENRLEPVLWQENYQEPAIGNRDLVVVARKQK